MKDFINPGGIEKAKNSGIKIWNWFFEEKLKIAQFNPKSKKRYRDNIKRKFEGQEKEKIADYTNIIHTNDSPGRPRVKFKQDLLKTIA